MKIACIDRAAADRLKLQSQFQKAFELCRDTFGYVSLVDAYPSTKEEVLLGAVPDAIAIGANFGLEESYLLVKELRHQNPFTPILLFLTESSYNLRTLRRFQPYKVEIFTKDESPVRLISHITTLANSLDKSSPGTLVALVGVKGGVGVTSLITGLAHAAVNLDKSVCIVDLSQHSSLAHFLVSTRFRSPDYASAILDKLSITPTFAANCISETPCGLSLLLPPSGGPDIRELWLRNHDSFETTLTLVDHLRDKFDLVLVDCANAEGILPFALLTRADARLAVTTNEPASVHLLAEALKDLFTIPGKERCGIICNLVYQNSLTKEDILDYLYTIDNFDPKLFPSFSIPYDTRGRHWVGTRNSFYTESHTHTQNALEQIIVHLLHIKENKIIQRSKSPALSKIFHRRKKSLPALEKRPLLPHLPKQEDTITPQLPTNQATPDSDLTSPKECKKNVPLHPKATLIGNQIQNLEDYFESPLSLANSSLRKLDTESIN